MNKPNFARDLKVGQAGELAFIALAAKHGIELKQTDGRQGDLVDSTGEIWEVKSDNYNHNATENFFLEIHGDVDRAKLGGCYKALSDNCTFYAYYFVKNNLAYIFNTADLCHQLDNYISLEKPKIVEIFNTKWTTTGIKAARRAFIPLYILDGKKETL